jgi:hypothetical protein
VGGSGGTQEVKSSQQSQFLLGQNKHTHPLLAKSSNHHTISSTHLIPKQSIKLLFHMYIGKKKKAIQNDFSYLNIPLPFLLQG